MKMVRHDSLELMKLKRAKEAMQSTEKYLGLCRLSTAVLSTIENKCESIANGTEWSQRRNSQPTTTGRKQKNAPGSLLANQPGRKPTSEDNKCGR